MDAEIATPEAYGEKLRALAEEGHGPVFTDEDIAKGTGEYLTLGPGYFSARRFAEKVTADFRVEFFESLLKDFESQFADRLWNAVQDSLISDTESNIQNHVWRAVDTIVQGLLSGETWIMSKYVLGERYDCEKVRATVARYVPAELQDKRIAELEKEIQGLRKRLGYF
jgi:hypothetical protein